MGMVVGMVIKLVVWLVVGTVVRMVVELVVELVVGMVVGMVLLRSLPKLNSLNAASLRSLSSFLALLNCWCPLVSADIEDCLGGLMGRGESRDCLMASSNSGVAWSRGTSLGIVLNTVLRATFG